MKIPRIGVGVIIRKDGKVLFGKRSGSHGDSTYSLPGGHLEYKESPEECAEREVFEETGLKIKNIKFGAVTNDVFEEEEKHYITLYLVCDYDSGEVQIKEPDKFTDIRWHDWNNPPQPLFLCMRNLYKQGFDPFKE